MPVLFHQNMMRFGGAVARNAAYDAAFAAINGALVGAPVSVAGFTEVMNNVGATASLAGPAAGTAAGLCPALGINYAGTIFSGITALGYTEYIGIGLNAAVALLAWGRVMISEDNRLVHQTSVGAPLPGWANIMPDAASLDYRGLVYVVVNLGTALAPRIAAIGFLHNMYTLSTQRVFVMAKLRDMAVCMTQNPALVGPNPEIYIGGDFNTDPMNRGGLTFHFAGTIAPALYPGVTLGGTTWAGSHYDYWYSANAVGVPNPAATQQTLDNNQMSDHAAILLNV